MPQFYLVLLIFVFVYYFLLTILKKQFYLYYNDKLNKLNLKINNDDKKRIRKVYNLNIIYIIIFISCMYLYNLTPYSKLIFNINSFKLIGFSILTFLLGLLCANGKKLIVYYLENFYLLIKSIILTTSTVLLFKAVEYYINPIVILFAALNIICIIEYVITLQKKKDQISQNNSTLHFVWLSLISFITSFILIYYIWIF